MLQNILRLAPIMVLSFCLISHNIYAQENGDLDSLVTDTKTDLLTVVGGGLAGAVLGLSTLSFVDEPKDHTNNIVIGASIGIIAGVAFVALSQANKTQDLLYGGEEDYQEEAKIDSIKSFDTTARIGWHGEHIAAFSSKELAMNQVSYKLKF
jgi:hypothetical protein